MNNMKQQPIHYSRHFADDRQQQRGVSNQDINFVLRFGSKKPDGHNALIYYFSDDCFRRMSKAGVDKSLIQQCMKKRALRLVVSRDKTLVTGKYAYQSHKRITEKK